jgi:hypothetical protein
VIDRANGAPIRKAHVYAATGLSLAILTETDENGAFCFEKLESGAYRLVAQRTGYLDVAYRSSRYMPGLPSINVTDPGTLDAVVIEMTPCGSWESPAIQIGKDGTFRPDGLLPTKYTLRLPGGGERVVDLTNGDAEDLLIEGGKQR